MDNRKISESSVIKRKSLLDKYVVKQEDNEISRYVMPADIKEKIQNIIAVKNAVSQKGKN